MDIMSLRIPATKIEKATNCFDDKNLIPQPAGESKAYKGKLWLRGRLINIVAQTFDQHETTKFETIVSALSSFKHENLVTFLGFCDDNSRQILVYKHEENGRLDEHLSKPSLKWRQRLQICYGVARALNYIHYDATRDVSVIHCNIKSCNILLDDKWEPMLSGLVHSLHIPVSKRHLAIDHARVVGTAVSMDPTYEKTKRVTQKSDVFSFGVLLFEVLCGGEADVNSDNAFLAQLAKSSNDVKGKPLDPTIDPNLREHMSSESLDIFKETAFWCLKEQRTHRPSMEQVIEKLDIASELQWKWEHQEHSPIPITVSSSDRLKDKNLGHLEIQWSKIVDATQNFAQKHIIGEGGYGVVYKATLEHFDNKCSSPAEEMARADLPTKCSIVALKRIVNKENSQGEQGFITEIELLTSCKHKNVISLLGFCNEGPSKQILVYEHASNGSLSDCLQSTVRMVNITWAQRIQICLDIAHGLNYLHTSMEEKQRIIHRDIKSDNILLDKDLNVKIADFGLSKFYPMSQQTTLITSTIAGTKVYLDPEYEITGKLKKESDVYSFGVVLFEILCGNVAYHPSYMVQNNKGLGPIARKSFQDGTINDMIDCNLKKDIDEIFSTQNRGLNTASVNIFSKIACECLSEKQASRPTMEFVINKLEEAFSSQESNKNTLKISHADLKLATQDFAHEVGHGEYWVLYKGAVEASGRRTPVVAKWLDDKLNLDREFFTELQTLFEIEHENIASLEHYCNDGSERIIVYGHASNGSLKRHLKNSNLTWMKRLKICIDLASALDFLHGRKDVVVHRDLNSSSILLTSGWKALIVNFGRCFVSSRDHDEICYEMDDSHDIFHYVDPVFHKEGNLTRESDIYSLGLVLFEILCGELVIDYSDTRYLPKLVKNRYEKDNIHEMVFKGIKVQTKPHSLTTFQTIAYQCLHETREHRPTASEVLVQLKKALEFQEDGEIWSPKLPADYVEILEKSKNPIDYSNDKKKDIYKMLSTGILFKDGNMHFSLGSNEERKEMISARTFSYKNCFQYKWRSIPESRFSKVAEVLNISNMKIRIKIKTHEFLSQNVNYMVHLIFKFCDQSKSRAKRMYVNLRYKKENENLHAYFATRREDDWMKIELGQFCNLVEHTNFEVLLEGFSGCYCPSRAIYIEGIEFQAIDDVRLEVINNSLRAQEGVKSFSIADKILFWRNKGAIFPMLSATEVLYDSSNMNLSKLKSPNKSRFQDGIELPSQKVFRIKCKIGSKVLSSSSKREYASYLVFKLSKECSGLYGPVIVHDILHWKNETRILYFRSPSPLNLNQLIDHIPKEREDGLMEVNVWKFDSTRDLRKDYIPMHLKLRTYEETFSGLVICGLEFRPI